MAAAHNVLRHSTTRHHYCCSLSVMRPIPHHPHQIDFDARVAAWEKNEAREASLASLASLLASPPRPESTPHNPHHPHHRTVHVWHATHRNPTSMDSRYPFLEILHVPRAAAAAAAAAAVVEPTPRLHHSSIPGPGPGPGPGSNRAGAGGRPNTRGWVAPGPSPDPAPIPTIPASQAPSLPPHRSLPVSVTTGPASSLNPLLSPLAVAQGNDTTRLHYDVRTLPLNLRLSARDPTTQGAPERYLPRSAVRHLIHNNAFHPSRSSICIVSSHFPWVITVEAAGHSDPILIQHVLSAIHTALHQRVTHEEWNQLPQAQQQRITSVWEDALALSDSGTPPPIPSAHLGPSSSWYTRLFPATAPTTPCCKPKYRRHANEAGILAPRPANVSGTKEAQARAQAQEREEQADEKAIVLRKRERTEGVLRVDSVCGKTRWGGLVKDDEIARRRGVPRERWERTWCLVLE